MSAKNVLLQRVRSSSSAIAVAACIAAGCRSGHDAGAGARSVPGDVERPATITGCIAEGYRPGEIVLIAIDPGVGSSTAADIAWQGTRQLTLILPDALREQARVGQRVVAAGTIVDPAGHGPSRTDQQQSAEGVPFREFRASSLQAAEGGCRSTAEFGRDTNHDTTKR